MNLLNQVTHLKAAVQSQSSSAQIQTGFPSYRSFTMETSRRTGRIENPEPDYWSRGLGLDTQRLNIFIAIVNRCFSKHYFLKTCHKLKYQAGVCGMTFYCEIITFQTTKAPSTLKQTAMYTTARLFFSATNKRIS